MKYFNYTKTVSAWLKCQLLLMFLLGAYAAQAQDTWNAPAQNSVYKRTVQWNYGGYTFTDQLTFNYSDYIYYRELSKTQPNANYATEHSSHPYLLQLAKVLDEDAKDLGYTGFKLAEYLTAFVQQAIPYKNDPYNGGWDYPKYPIETIVEQGGDCEDKAALLVALLKTFGFDAVMVRLPGHMAAAINCANCNGYYTYNGYKYAFIETTYQGWNIGVVPPESRNVGAMLLQTTELKEYKREDVYARNGKNNIGETPYPNNGWNNTKPNGSNWNINTIGKSNKITTVIINGTTYQIKGIGKTNITVNGTTITVLTQ